MALHQGKDMELVVLAGNEHAIKLYKKCGFSVEKELEGFSLAGKKPTCLKMVHANN